MSDRQDRTRGEFWRGAAVGAGAALAVAVCLGAADAREQPSGGLANPADQRNQMIAELRRLNESVSSLRGALEGGAVTVRVAEPARAR